MPKIRTLGIGAQFTKPGYLNDAVWQIIGRARPSGKDKPGGKEIATVKAIHIPATKDDPDAYGARYFNIDDEVKVVARARKTVEAIDSRDMPEEVETLDQVARREGVDVPEPAEV